MTCPHCGSSYAWRNGHKPDGRQRWLCKNCGREHVEGRARGLSSTEYNLLLAVADEKQAERLVCVQNGTEKGAEMSTEQVISRRSGLLKDFPEEIRTKILEFAIRRVNQGCDEVGTKEYVYRLKYLLKAGADLHDPESVKTAIAKAQWSDTKKFGCIAAYSAFLKFLGATWEKPKYMPSQKLPFIPLESEIDQLIAGCSRNVSAFLQVLKETGARCGEAARLKWTDIDFEKNIVSINEPEKKSNPRQVKVSGKLIAMLNALPRKSERIFSPKNYLARSYYVQRKRLSQKLNNPRLAAISLHTFRHWHATMLYHKTQNLKLVKERLGHKSILNTDLYTHLVTFEGDEYDSAAAQTVEEGRKLVEAGFEYVCDFNGVKIFRKRK